MTQQNILTADALTLGRQWTLPDRGTIGILMLILTESVLFMMFAAAYLVYVGQSVTGPYPRDVLRVPVVSTICLFSSSFTIFFAEHSLKKNQIGRFKLWLLATILLGAEFLTATAFEWRQLIYQDHLTISTNLFGTTFYSLVGLHATHVLVGLIFLLLAMLATVFGFPIQQQLRRVTFLSWYWHFVDAVWVVVFSVVYLIGK
ncbi:MAG TPA: heme-copper oxidase subunit III [Bryobacteraceae bacterium]|jgi:cytochrome c oxidase subunit 3/cytochrome o ubiquinol oxidase subunit 3